MSRRRLLDEESGQATIEYVLILAIMVAMALVLIQQLLLPAIEALKGYAGAWIEDRVFSGGDSMHRSPFGK